MCGGKLFQVPSPILLEDLDVENSRFLPLPSPPAAINKTSQKFSVICTPLFKQSGSNIDSIYSQTEPLVRKAMSLLRSEATLDQLRDLKMEAEQVREVYNAWPETIPKEWTPRSMGFIASKDDGAM